MKKKESAINKKLNIAVEDGVKKTTVDIIRVNKAIDKFKVRIDELYGEITQYAEGFEKQRVLSNKLASIQRLLYATKMGLNRQKIKIYDIDENVIKEEIIRGM